MPMTGPPLLSSFPLGQILKRGVKAKPHDLALVSAQARWTWHELDQASDRLAGNFLGLGLRAGDRVASLMPNRAVLVVHYLACLKAGLIATPLNYRYTPPEIDHALEVSQASILFVHAERAQDIAASQHASELPLGYISYGGVVGRGAPNLTISFVRNKRVRHFTPPGSPSSGFYFFYFRKHRQTEGCDP